MLAATQSIGVTVLRRWYIHHGVIPFNPALPVGAFWMKDDQQVFRAHPSAPGWQQKSSSHT